MSTIYVITNKNLVTRHYYIIGLVKDDFQKVLDKRNENETDESKIFYSFMKWRVDDGASVLREVNENFITQHVHDNLFRMMPQDIFALMQMCSAKDIGTGVEDIELPLTYEEAGVMMMKMLRRYLAVAEPRL